MVEPLFAKQETTDRYRSPAPIRHGSSKVERLIEAQRVGGASPSRGAILPLSLEDLECILGGAGIGMLTAMAFRTIELYLR